MFIYLTRWNLFATMVAMLLGANLATRYYKSQKVSDDMRRAIKVYWLLSNVAVVFSLCISPLYWTLLYKEEDSSLNNWLVHATNSIFLVVDLFIVRHPCRLSHFVFPVAGGTIYMLFSLAYPLLGGHDPSGHNYVYPILDWKNNTQMALFVGFGTVTFSGIIHVIVGVIHLVREVIYRHVTALTINEQALLPFTSQCGEKRKSETDFSFLPSARD
jgi:hypothetical protein